MPEDQENLHGFLTRIQQEDQQALGELYDATVNRVFGFVLKLTGSHPLTEEVIGDVYLQVWRKAASFESDRASPMGWLLMMARSRAYDAMRQEKSRTKLQDALPEKFDAPDLSTPDPLISTVASEQSSKLQQALMLLDEQQRQMIALAFYRDMTHSEIAAYIGLPLGTVKTTLRRSQAILRAAMTEPDLIQRDYYEQA